MASPTRRFDFDCDTFAFANELHWAYTFDAATGRTTFSRREPRPTYAHRCFVLTRAARQFFYHARFDPAAPPEDEPTVRRKICAVMSRSALVPVTPFEPIVFHGFAGLREFSTARECLLKAECGGAWRSYVLRSHWRMVFPISRPHQSRTARQLALAIAQGIPPLIHLVCFPKLTINHGMVLFAAEDTPDAILFSAYDPNDPAKPTRLSFSKADQTFRLPANAYWAGGELNVIEIYRSWLL